MLVEVDVLVLVDEEVEVLVEVLDDDEVEVHVKSEFPNKCSLIVFMYYSPILRYDYSCSSTLRTAIQRHIVLYRKNPYFSTADSRPVFYNSCVVKG